MGKERGSVLILSLVVVLILSIMAIAGLTVTSIENETTANYYRTKQAFYKAVEVVEKVRMQIYENQDPVFITGISYSRSGTREGNDTIYTEYCTGDMVEFEDVSSPATPIGMFLGFNAPQFRGMSMDDRIGAAPVIWYVPVTALKKTGRSKAYSEIQSGIYSTLAVAH